MADRSVVVRLRAEAGSYLATMGAAGASTRKLAADLAMASAAGKKGTAELAHGAGLTGVAMLGMAGFAVKAFADFDASMSRVKANSHATSGEFNQLKQSAIDLGNKTKFSATEAADAQNELAKAGMEVKEIIGALPGTMALAAAAEMGLADAASITTATLAQFHLRASDAGHVADVLASGADKSRADVQGLGEALKYAAPAAYAMGVGLEETVGVLAMFAQNGMEGSKAGTAFVDVITRVSGRSLKAANVIEDLGLRFFDAKGQFVGMAAVADELHNKLGKLTQKDRIDALKTLFGLEGLQAGIALMNSSGDEIEKWTKRVDDAGFAAKNAATKTDNLKGDFEKLTSTLQGNLIKAGSGANGVLRSLTQGATRLSDQVSNIPGPLAQVAFWTTAVGGATLTAGGAYGTLAPKISAARGALEGLGPTGARANAMLGKMGKAAGAAAAAFVVLEIAGAATHAIQDSMIGATPGVEQFTAAFRMLAETGNDGGLDRIGVSMNRLQESLRRLTSKSGAEKFTDAMQTPFTGIFGDAKSLAQAKRDFEGVDKSLAQMVASGHAQQAAIALAQIGVSAADARKLLPGYTEAVTGAANASGAGAGKNKDGAAALGEVAKQAASAAEAVKSYSDALRGMTPEGQLIQDTIAMNKALGDAKDQLRGAGRAALDHSGNLDLTTKSGQEAAAALISVAQSARSVAAGVREAGQSEAEANAKLAAGRTAFLGLAHAAGLSSAKANELADSLGLIPVHTDATIATPGATRSTHEVLDLRGQIKLLQSKIVVAKANGANESSASVRNLRAQITALRGKVVDVFVNTYKKNFVSTVDNGVRGGKGNTLGGVLPGRAAGGSVRKNQPYWVGEDGPELMFPDRSGTIVPNRPSEDIARRFAGSVAWTGGGMAASGSSGGGGGRVVAELSPRAEATITALADRVVHVESVLKVDSEVVARANNKGQRIVRQKG